MCNLEEKGTGMRKLVLIALSALWQSQQCRPPRHKAAETIGALRSSAGSLAGSLKSSNVAAKRSGGECIARGTPGSVGALDTIMTRVIAGTIGTATGNADRLLNSTLSGGVLLFYIDVI